MLFAVLLALAPPATTAEAKLKSAVEPRLTNLSEMIGPDDYPVEAMRANAQGTAHVRVRVNAEGEPESCKVVTSSGNAELDGQTCSVIMARGRFSPGKDRRRRSVTADADVRIRWLLPKEDSRPIASVQRVVLTVGPDGKLRNCEMRVKADSQWIDAPPGICEKREYPTELLMAVREGSKLHDAVVVDENYLLLDANEPWPDPGQGAGEKLIAIRAIQLSFAKDGSLKSCKIVRDTGLPESQMDWCSEARKDLGWIAVQREADMDMRFIKAIYLAKEPN